MFIQCSTRGCWRDPNFVCFTCSRAVDGVALVAAKTSRDCVCTCIAIGVVLCSAHFAAIYVASTFAVLITCYAGPPPHGQSGARNSSRTCEQSSETARKAELTDVRISFILLAFQIVQHLRAQANAADTKARVQQEAAVEESKRREAMEKELKQAHADNVRLLMEMRKVKERVHDAERRDRTKDLQAEVDFLRKQRDYWHANCQKALAARDAAVTSAMALRESLLDAPPGEASGQAVTLWRAQLIQCRSRKEAHKQRAAAEANRADSLQLRCDALERELNALNRAR